MKAWLRGGAIGLFLGIFVSVLAVLYSMGGRPSVTSFLLVSLILGAILFIVGAIIGVLTDSIIKEKNWLKSVLMVFLFWLVFVILLFIYASMGSLERLKDTDTYEFAFVFSLILTIPVLILVLISSLIDWAVDNIKSRKIAS